MLTATPADSTRSTHAPAVNSTPWSVLNTSGVPRPNASSSMSRQNAPSSVFDTRHAYADGTIALYFYRCTLAGTPRPLLGQEMQWIPRRGLAALGFPPADAELIRRLTASAAHSVNQQLRKKLRATC